MAADQLKTREELLAELTGLRMQLGDVSGQLAEIKRSEGHDRYLQDLINDFMSPVTISSLVDRRMRYINEYASRYFGVTQAEAASRECLRSLA